MKSEPSQTGEEKLRSHISKKLQAALNLQGYSFQDAVYKDIARTWNQTHPWAPWVSELPVGAEGNSTRIDLVLSNPMGTVYLVCECKRVNQSLADWCFVGSSFQVESGAMSGPGPRAYIETLEKRNYSIVGPAGNPDFYLTKITAMNTETSVYQRGIEIKGDTHGERGGDGRGQIEAAATQLCRGLNGFVDFMIKHPALRRDKDRVFGVLPVIITTARLWGCKADLSEASLKTGNLDSPINVTSEPWLWYQFPQSEALKHSAKLASESANIGELLYREFIRPIAVVNSSHIQEFLTAKMWHFLDIR